MPLRLVVVTLLAGKLLHAGGEGLRRKWQPLDVVREGGLKDPSYLGASPSDFLPCLAFPNPIKSQVPLLYSRIDWRQARCLTRVSNRVVYVPPGFHAAALTTRLPTI